MTRAPQRLKELRQKQSGFTIIEVMIVLAVAATIMLIVFLAIPALQRSSRNTQRTADASKIASAVNECLSNRNGQVSSCDSSAEILNQTLDPGTLQRLGPPPAGGGITFNANNVVPAAAPAGFPANTTNVNVYYNAKCTTAGDSYTTGAGVLSTQFVILFNTESSSGGNINRCVGGSA